MNDEGLADAVAASPFRLPPRDVRPGILQARGQGNRRALEVFHVRLAAGIETFRDRIASGPDLLESSTFQP